MIFQQDIEECFNISIINLLKMFFQQDIKMLFNFFILILMK